MSNIFLLRADRLNPNDDEMLLNAYCIDEGDEIMKGDIVATVETSKAVIDIESTVSGKIIELLFKKGEMVKVGDAIIKIKLNEKLAHDSIPNLKINSNVKSKQDNKKNKKFNLREKLDQRGKSLISSDNASYRNNYINHFTEIEHGEHCYIGINVTLTNVILGENVWINRDTNIYTNNPDHPIRIGSGSYIGPYVWIEGHGGIEIGKCVHITGPGTCLYTHSGMKTAIQGNYALNPDDKKKYDKHYFHQPIKIGNNVWIGPNCTLFPGTTIQDNVVILPNTLVKSGTIKSYSLAHPDGDVEKNSSFVRNLSAAK
jgi:acetyltransferase-like isoleucine patch superfamily enzyme